MGHKIKYGSMPMRMLDMSDHMGERDIGRDERECILAEWRSGVSVARICHRHDMSRRQCRRILRDMAGYDVDAYTRDMDVLTGGRS